MYTKKGAASKIEESSVSSSGKKSGTTGEKGGTASSAKKRGRPRKKGIADESSASDTCEPSKETKLGHPRNQKDVSESPASDSGASSPGRKKRGRPAKGKDDGTSPKTGATKKRGRRPKADADPNADANADADRIDMPKAARKRSRHPKSASVTDSPAKPKRRGRPPKIAESNQPSEVASAVIAARPETTRKKASRSHYHGPRKEDYRYFKNKVKFSTNDGGGDFSTSPTQKRRKTSSEKDGAATLTVAVVKEEDSRDGISDDASSVPTAPSKEDKADDRVEAGVDCLSLGKAQEEDDDDDESKEIKNDENDKEEDDDDDSSDGSSSRPAVARPMSLAQMRNTVARIRALAEKVLLKENGDGEGDSVGQNGTGPLETEAETETDPLGTDRRDDGAVDDGGGEGECEYDEDDGDGDGDGDGGKRVAKESDDIDYEEPDLYLRKKRRRMSFQPLAIEDLFCSDWIRRPNRLRRGMPPELQAATEEIRAADTVRRAAIAELVAAYNAYEESKLRIARALEAERRSAERIREASSVLVDIELKKDEAWNHMYHRLEKFKEEYGHCFVSLHPDVKTDPDLRKLHSWVKSCHNMYREYQIGKRQTTRPYRIVALERIGVFLGRWQLRFHQLKEFKEKNGHCNVPTRGYAANKQLGGWVGLQRTEYSKRMDGRRNTLTDERIRQLNELGFCWNVFDAKGITRRRKYSDRKSPSELKAPSENTPEEERAPEAARELEVIGEEQQGVVVNMGEGQGEVADVAQMTVGRERDVDGMEELEEVDEVFGDNTVQAAKGEVEYEDDSVIEDDSDGGRVEEEDTDNDEEGGTYNCPTAAFTAANDLGYSVARAAQSATVTEREVDRNAMVLAYLSGNHQGLVGSRAVAQAAAAAAEATISGPSSVAQQQQHHQYTHAPVTAATMTRGDMWRDGGYVQASSYDAQTAALYARLGLAAPPTAPCQGAGGEVGFLRAGGGVGTTAEHHGANHPAPGGMAAGGGGEGLTALTARFLPMTAAAIRPSAAAAGIQSQLANLHQAQQVQAHSQAQAQNYNLQFQGIL